jgi:hypothetical protein
MPLSRRYTVEGSPLDGCIMSYDFSTILPKGVGIQWPGQDYSQLGVGTGFGTPTGEDIIIPTPRLEIWTNTAIPSPAPEDWYVDPRYAPPNAKLTFGNAPGQPWWWIYDDTVPLQSGVGNTSNPRWWQSQFNPATPSSTYATISLGCYVVGRKVFANVGGGDPGVDYQFRWTITDTLGSRWTRTGLLLVGPTS